MLMENPNDVKELIPEFFYLPEFLVNMNGKNCVTSDENLLINNKESSGCMKRRGRSKFTNRCGTLND